MQNQTQDPELQIAVTESPTHDQVGTVVLDPPAPPAGPDGTTERGSIHSSGPRAATDQGGTRMGSERHRECVEQQQEYMGSLSDDFSFTLFNARTALESQRRSGYRTTAAAAREIVDNAIEAGASDVHIVCHSQKGRKSVSAMAIIDNGSGMIPDMIRAALTWGSGTHLSDHDFIGKFGFGLPNSSINQTRRVEVYSRTASSEPFRMCYLDINEFAEHGQQVIGPPQEQELPDWVKKYLKRAKLDLASGTVVVWVAPDRLSYRKVSTLKEHLLDDFGVVYRYILRRPDETADSERPQIVIEGVQVAPVDPLFLDPRSRFYEPAVGTGEDGGGAVVVVDRDILVKFREDAESGERHLERVLPGDSVDPSASDVLALENINVRIARFPVGFVLGSKRSAKDQGRPEAYYRWNIRKSRRGISFVRANREIETVDAFPRRDQDVASGLGKWPLLQGYAYHWAIEIRVTPGLDEAMGITNDKQSVRPLEDLWRVLHEEDIDTLLQAEQAWQKKAREKRKEDVELTRPDTPTKAELAAQVADSARGEPVRPHGPHREKSEEDIKKAAESESKNTNEKLDEAEDRIRSLANKHRYRIEYFENEYGPFYEPEMDTGQFVIRVNKAHPFFKTLYAEVLGTAAKDAVDVLLITLGRSELTVAEEQLSLFYQVQRRDKWSPFLKDALGWLSQAEAPVEEELDLVGEQG